MNGNQGYLPSEYHDSRVQTPCHRSTVVVVRELKGRLDVQEGRVDHPADSGKRFRLLGEHHLFGGDDESWWRYHLHSWIVQSAPAWSKYPHALPAADRLVRVRVADSRTLADDGSLRSGANLRAPRIEDAFFRLDGMIGSFDIDEHLEFEPIAFGWRYPAEATA